MLEGSILQQLEAAHQKSRKPLNFGVYYKNTLVALCHALEDFMLESDSAPLMVTAFQQGKWYLEEAERYAELAQKASQVAIMAAAGTGFLEHPTSQLPNVKLVSLELNDPVAQEWHLMILSPTYAAMVLCQELSSSDYGVEEPPANDLERKFYGFWTFEPELVLETVNLAIAHIGRYDPELESDLKDRVQQISAAVGTQKRDDLGAVVSRVVDYLQTSQDEIAQLGYAPAEAAPLHEKALDDNLVSNELQAFLRMAQLIDQADATNPMAAAEVAALSEALGQLLDLPAWQLKRLRLAGLLHRLAPLQGVGDILEPAKSTEQTAIKGTGRSLASVLRLMPRLQAIAHIITHQTECWNGSGTPDCLAYDRIPLESRILGLVADFQQRLTAHQSAPNPLVVALAECQEKAGAAFDPKLVEALALLVMGLQQGMSLQATQPKIASGMWLLDSRLNEDVLGASSGQRLKQEG